MQRLHLLKDVGPPGHTSGKLNRLTNGTIHVLMGPSRTLTLSDVSSKQWWAENCDLDRAHRRTCWILQTTRTLQTCMAAGSRWHAAQMACHLLPTTIPVGLSSLSVCMRNKKLSLSVHVWLLYSALPFVIASISLIKKLVMCHLQLCPHFVCSFVLFIFWYIFRWFCSLAQNHLLDEEMK